MPEKITLEIARPLLKRAMETQGRNFRYVSRAGVFGTCFYVPLEGEYLKQNEAKHGRKYLDVIPGENRTKTGCLIGTALTLHDVDMSLIAVNTTKIQQFPLTYPNMIDQEAADYFQEAQYQQDRGSTWGDAYDAAEKWVERLAKQRANMIKSMFSCKDSPDGVGRFDSCPGHVTLKHFSRKVNSVSELH